MDASALVVDMSTTPLPSTSAAEILPVDSRPLLPFAEDCTDENWAALGQSAVADKPYGCISGLDTFAASKAAAAAIVRACNTPAAPDDQGRLYVVFKEDGSVALAVAQEPWRSSSLRECVESAARTVHVRPFVGRSRTYGMVFHFPPGDDGGASIPTPLYAPDAGR
jgi:hypothetical protein